MTGSDWRRRRGSVLAGALVLLLVLPLIVSVLPAYASTVEPPPQLPHYFTGTVSTSRGPVPQGTVVEAFLAGVKKADATVNAQSRYELLVSGNYGDEGKTVSFKVGGVQAGQTAAWTPGEFSFDFDLTIPSLPGDNGFPFPLPFDCFIATAAYGTGVAEEINILREFRDVVLLGSRSGAGLVSLYYQIGPAIAEVISQHEFLRTAVRVGFITPIVALLDWSQALWSEGD